MFLLDHPLLTQVIPIGNNRRPYPSCVLPLFQYDHSNENEQARKTHFHVKGFAPEMEAEAK